MGKAWYVKHMAVGRRSYPGQVASAGRAGPGGIFRKVCSTQLEPGGQQLGTGKSKHVGDPEQAAPALVIQKQVSHRCPGRKGSLTRTK